MCVCLDGERVSREVEFFFSRERVFREIEFLEDRVFREGDIFF